MPEEPVFPSLPLDPGIPGTAPLPQQSHVRQFMEDIQGGILASAGRGEVGALLVFRFKRPMSYLANAAAIREAAPMVTTAWAQYEAAFKLACSKIQSDPKGNRDHPFKAACASSDQDLDDEQTDFVSLSLSGLGIRRCGVKWNPREGKQGDGHFPADLNHYFDHGMRNAVKRAVTPPGEVEAEKDLWSKTYQKNRFHGAFLVGQKDAGRLEALIGRIQTWCDSQGIEIVEIEHGLQWRPDGVNREPFGFADGLSGPRFFEWQKRQLLAGMQSACPFNHGGGEPSNVSPPNGAADVCLDSLFLQGGVHTGGAFLVFKKLDQKVAAFRRSGSIKERESKVGRKADGMPFVSEAHRLAIESGDRDSNDFNFKDPETAAACPMYSHVRRANPRDDIHVKPMVRRSWVYGEDSELNSEQGVESGVGLLFLAYMDDIENFIVVNGNWLQSPDHPQRGGRETGQLLDPLLFGRDNGDRFVTPKGGEYFYVPSLKWLSSVRPER